MLLLFLFILFPSLIHAKELRLVKLDTLSISKGGSEESISLAIQSFKDCVSQSDVSMTIHSYTKQVLVILEVEIETMNHVIHECSLENWPVEDHATPKVFQGERVIPMAEYAHQMTGINRVKNMGLTGKGIKVAILDTGIDYRHPAFGQCSAPSTSSSVPEGCRIKKTIDFSTSNGMEAGKDCVGHGTHIAGIIAGNDTIGEVLGVAPGVALYDYRIFSCQGRTSSSTIIKALEMAQKDGVDIINLSIGMDVGSPDSATSQFVNALVDSGFIVTVAAGNIGMNGFWTMTDPAVAQNSMAVASFDNIAAPRRMISVDKFSFPTAHLISDFSRIKNAELTTIIVQGNEAMNACSINSNMNITGKIVLVRRGDCDISTKAQNIAKGKGVAMLLYNNIPGDIGPLSLALPVLTVLREDGLKLVQELKKNPSLKLKFDEKDIPLLIPTGGNLSSFSSWGLSPDLTLKPEFGAPGGNIYSAYPIDMGSYYVQSGTSMAAPYVAGSIALYLEHMMKQNTPVTGKRHLQIRTIMSNYASAVRNHDIPNKDIALSVASQGTGLLEMDKVILGTSRAEPSFISAKDVSKPYRTNITIFNMNKTKKKRYLLSHDAASTVRITDATNPISLSSSGELKFITPNGNTVAQYTVDVAPNSSIRVQVQISMDKDVSLDEFHMISGFIEISPKTEQSNGTFTEETDDSVLSVAYAGVQGNFMNLEVFHADNRLQPTLRWNFRNVSASSTTRETKLSTDMELEVNNFDYSFDTFQVAMAIKVPLSNMELVLTNDKRVELGSLTNSSFISRSLKTNSGHQVIATSWNGKMNGQPLSAGQYHLKLKYKVYFDLRQPTLRTRWLGSFNFTSKGQ